MPPFRSYANLLEDLQRGLFAFKDARDDADIKALVCACEDLYKIADEAIDLADHLYERCEHLQRVRDALAVDLPPPWEPTRTLADARARPERWPMPEPDPNGG